MWETSLVLESFLPPKVHQERHDEMTTHDPIGVQIIGEGGVGLDLSFDVLSGKFASLLINKKQKPWRSNDLVAEIRCVTPNKSSLLDQTILFLLDPKLRKEIDQMIIVEIYS